MQHDPNAYLLDVLLAAKRAVGLTGDLGLEEFVADERTAYAVYAQFIIIGEAARRIPEPFQTARPQFPWAQMIGMRNRLVHGYDKVIWERVWETVRRDLPPLIEAIGAMLPIRELE